MKKMLSGVLRLCKLSYCRHLSDDKIPGEAKQKRCELENGDLTACKFYWFSTYYSSIDSPRHSLLARYSWSLFSGWNWMLGMIWINNFQIPSLHRSLFDSHPSSIRNSPTVSMYDDEKIRIWGELCLSAQEVVEFQWQYFILMDVIATDVFLILLLNVSCLILKILSVRN